MNNLISVIIPCFNQCNFLNESLNSVLLQTYEHWECLIINDGSDDLTEKLALEWQAKDSRFKYFYKENGGLSSARNFGLDRMKGNFVQFLDCDDLIEKTKFEKSIKIFESYSKNQIVISDFKMFRDDIKNLNDPFCKLSQNFLNFKSILLKWDREFVIPIHCGLFRVKTFDDLRFEEDLKAKEDWIMWIEMFKNEIETFFIDQNLAFYRLHNNNMTKNTELMVLNNLKAYKFIKKIIPLENYILFLETKTEEFYVENIKLNIFKKEVKKTIAYRLSQKIARFKNNRT